MVTHLPRWLLGALLFAPCCSSLFAQQRGAAAPEADLQRAEWLPPAQLAVAPATVQLPRQGAQRPVETQRPAPATVQPPQGGAPQPGALQRLAPAKAFRDCADCPEMVEIPPGILTITAPDSEAVQAPGGAQQHSVAIAGIFSIGQYEVTKAQFARFVRESGHLAGAGCFAWNGSKYQRDAAKDWRNPGFAQADDHPVVCVSWNDAKAYAEWLTKKTGKRYRLPTESEWEYAARAGSQESRPWGDNPGDACAHANVADASTKRDVAGTTSWKFHECDDNYAYTAPVGSYPPNAFGLYDTLGNAWEWTEDCWNEEPTVAPPDGRDRPADHCGRRVLRGGSWVDSPPFVLYDFRFLIGAGDRDFYAGFRVARTQ